jgi:N6-adenosine-specific RNA methylase IME4
MPRREPGYGVILADPPWTFRNYSPKGEDRNANQHYETMSIGEIAEYPLPRLRRNCALFLWATDPMLPEALYVMKHWGFVYSTVAFHWIKQTKSGEPFTGLGYWTRANPELCLFGTRGRPTRQSRAVRRALFAPRREHSRKPDEVYGAIEQLLAGPYIELFARQRWPGWDAEGNGL